MGTDERRDRWGEPTPVWVGDALTDLHDGAGTPWQRTAAGTWYPDCDCHRPSAIATALEAENARQRSFRAERYEAWQRANPEGPTAPASATRSPKPPVGVPEQHSGLRRFLKGRP